MRKLQNSTLSRSAILLIIILLFIPGKIIAQKISFGVFADPVISWFSSDNKGTSNKGARAGFNFGFTFNKYFADNYAFSTGLSLTSTGGRLANSDTVLMSFNNFSQKVPPNITVVYKIQYLNIPIGLKFKSNQIGYFTIFSDIGIDPKVVIGGKVDINDPNKPIHGEGALKELNRFNLSYHVMAGIEYSLGGSTAMVLGLGYENNFLDITKDINKQPIDRITHNILKIRVGVNF
jgi:hypothetical protein